jgi:hypothetical protein
MGEQMGPREQENRLNFLKRMVSSASEMEEKTGRMGTTIKP